MHLRVKKLNLDIFSYAVRANPSHRFKNHPPPLLGKSKLLIPSRSLFFKNLSPYQKGCGRKLCHFTTTVTGLLSLSANI